MPGGTTDTSPSNWRLVFTPSLDHDGIVDRYVAEIYALDRWALVWASNLGRPTILAGECAVDLTQSVGALPPGQ